MSRKKQVSPVVARTFLQQMLPARVLRIVELIPRWVNWVVFDIQANHLRLHTAGLVYTSLLTMIPMMAVVFALLKTFDAHLWVEPFLFQYLAPLGPGKSLQITEQIMLFITNTRVGVLGTVSVGILLFAVIKLAQQVEAAFNSIWFVARPRSWWQRAKDSLTLLMLGPILVAATLGTSAAAKDWGPLKVIFDLPMIQGVLAHTLAIFPIILTLATMWLVYLWAPNTRIGKLPALAGALTALVLWKVMGVIFQLFIAGSAQYEAIYSGFAAAILFVMWLYFSWLILLVGAQVSYWVQHRRYLDWQPHGVLTPATRLRLSLEACAMIAKAHHNGDKAPSVDDISRSLHLPPGETEALLMPLFDAELLSKNEQDGLAPKQATHKVTLQKLVTALQGKIGGNTETIDQICQTLLAAQQKAVAKLTWSDLA